METNNILHFSDSRFENLIFITVNINGHDVTAMFDTGAGMSFITKGMAEKLGGKTEKAPLKAGNNQGVVRSFDTVRFDSVRVGNMTVPVQMMGVLPDEALTQMEDSKHNRFPAAMLLGKDIISLFCWSFDMEARYVTVSPGGTMPKKGNMRWDAFPEFSIAHDGKAYTVGFDSGHTESFLDNSWLKILDNLSNAKTVVQGIGSSIDEHIKIADSFSFTIDKTAVTLKNIEIADHIIYGAENSGICALLGADILEGACWTCDFKSGCFEIGRL